MSDVRDDIKNAVETWSRRPALRREAVICSPGVIPMFEKLTPSEVMFRTPNIVPHFYGIPIHEHPAMVGWRLVPEKDVPLVLAWLDLRIEERAE